MAMFYYNKAMAKFFITVNDNGSAAFKFSNI